MSTYTVVEGSSMGVVELGMVKRIGCVEITNYNKTNVPDTIRAQVDRMVGMVSSSFTVEVKRQAVMEVVRADYNICLPYMKVAGKCAPEPEVDSTPVPAMWEAFKGLFCREEIQSWMAWRSEKEIAYFKKNSPFPPILTPNFRPTSLLTRFNVAALTKLINFTNNSGHNGPCQCVWYLPCMPEVAPHRCVQCGGLSNVDERMQFLSLQTRNFLLKTHFAFTPSGGLVIDHEGKLYCDKILSGDDVNRFVTEVILGKAESAIVQPPSNTVTEALAPVLPVSDTASIVNRVNSRKGVVLIRCDMSNGIPVRTILCDVENSVVSVLPANVNISSYFKGSDILIDPEIYIHIDQLSYRHGAGNIGIPPWNGQFGYACYGVRKSCSAAIGIAADMYELFGIIVPNLTGLTYGVYKFTPDFKMLSHSQIITNLRCLVYGDCQVRCVICGKPCLKRPAVAVAGAVRGTPSILKNGIECDVICGICKTLPFHANKYDFKTIFTQIGLAELFCCNVVAAGAPLQAWCCDPSKFNLLASSAGLRMSDGAKPQYNFIGRSKDEALRKYYVKLFHLLWVAGANMRIADMVTPSQLMQVRYMGAALMLNKVVGGHPPKINWGVFYQTCPIIFRQYMDTNFGFSHDGLIPLEIEKLHSAVRVWIADGFSSIVSLTQVFGTGYRINDNDLMDRVNASQAMVDLLSGRDDITIDDVLNLPML